MKHNYLMLLLIASMVSLSLVACEKDPNNNNSDNNQSENGKPVVEMINDAVTDIDGNHYKAVKIGKQVWMSENLKTKHYADGTEIPVADKQESIPGIGYIISDSYKASEVDPYLYEKGGYCFYNWSAVMYGSNSSNTNPSGIQGVCPDGWHVPSWAEWQELKNYVSSYTQFQYDSCETCIGKALAATSGWISTSGHEFTPGEIGYDQGSNNATGFSAKPAGAMLTLRQLSIPTARYHANNEAAIFWSTTNNGSGLIIAWLKGSNKGFDIASEDQCHPNYISQEEGAKVNGLSGLSVRCVRN